MALSKYQVSQTHASLFEPATASRSFRSKPEQVRFPGFWAHTLAWIIDKWSFLDTGKFPTESKKANVVQVYKKGDQKILKNYLLVFLLPVFGNLFEKLIFNRMFTFFMENDLTLSNQSGYKPGGSCINLTNPLIVVMMWELFYWQFESFWQNLVQGCRV